MDQRESFNYGRTLSRLHLQGNSKTSASENPYISLHLGLSDC